MESSALDDELEKFETDVDTKASDPWEVASIYDFYYSCCPECDSKSQNKQEFVNHASNIHPWVSLKLFSKKQQRSKYVS